jgi:hypothetical protein
MSRWIVTHEALLRGSAFIVVFAVVAIAETVEAWPHNLGLTVLNTVVLRLIFPLGATSTALWSAAHGIGFLQLVPFRSMDRRQPADRRIRREAA